MDDKIQTSQQQNGEHHLAEGQGNEAVAPDVQYGTETSGAPGPVTQPIKGEITQIDGLSTSQQRAGEVSVCES